MLNLGDSAPDMEVLNHFGERKPLSDYWKDGPLVLFFYPKDETTVCTKQACSMQSLDVFAELNATVVGASLDSLESHKKFAERHGLTFPLIVDEEAQLAKAYDAYRGWLLKVAKRISYVIDSGGIIRGRVHAEFSVGTHIEMIKKVLGEIA